MFAKSGIFRYVFAAIEAEVFAAPFERYNRGAVEQYLEVSPSAHRGRFAAFVFPRFNI